MSDSQTEQRPTNDELWRLFRDAAKLQAEDYDGYSHLSNLTRRGCKLTVIFRNGKLLEMVFPLDEPYRDSMRRMFQGIEDNGMRVRQ